MISFRLPKLKNPQCSNTKASKTLPKTVFSRIWCHLRYAKARLLKFPSNHWFAISHLPYQKRCLVGIHYVFCHLASSAKRSVLQVVQILYAVDVSKKRKIQIIPMICQSFRKENLYIIAYTTFLPPAQRSKM